MNSSNSPFFLQFLFIFFANFLFHETPFHVLGQQTEDSQHGYGFGGRVLMSLKEKPAGSNFTFDCAPSGPCVPCIYSEKGDEKYRCSETGYRIPFKCEESKGSKKDAEKTNPKKTRTALEISSSIAKSHKVSHVFGAVKTSQPHRTLLDDSLASNNKSQAYVTYRSCIPADSEEKLSVLGFEGVVIFLLLISGTFVYLKKKRAAAMSGYVAAGRGQPNSRF
ncbi:uncharacterized protein LOC131651570 [Vicia villosa]|uniref:uncharacterized protein LOC131651570 n=1 Tax=Vicia villosa TaxID=3911 RepID=UPI00273A7AD1|nr:uncharacterized protein LOC131651570 [Vicia villosa]